MRWGAKVTDTAKISYHGRGLFLDKVEHIIDRLHGVRCRAMQHASPQSIAAFAAEVPLPCASATEHDELRDASAENGTAKKQASPPRDELAWSTWGDPELACETWCCGHADTQEEAFTIQGTWLELANLIPDVPDSFGCLAFTYDDEESGQTSNESFDATSDCVFFGSEGFQYEYEAPELTQSQRSDHSVCANQTPTTDNPVDSKLGENHVLLAPWDQTFPGKLEQYLNCCDETGLESSCALPHHGLDIHSSLGPSYMVPGGSSPISGAHLLRLQKDIEEVYKHRRSFSQSMYDVKKSLRCHRSR